MCYDFPWDSRMILSVFIYLHEVGKGTFPQDYIHQISSPLLAMLQLPDRVRVS